MPRGQEAARGAKKRGLLVADRGAWHGVSAAVAFKALQLDELSGLGGLLDGVEKRERLDVIGGGSSRAVASQFQGLAVASEMVMLASAPSAKRTLTTAESSVSKPRAALDCIPWTATGSPSR